MNVRAQTHILDGQNWHVVQPLTIFFLSGNKFHVSPIVQMKNLMKEIPARVLHRRNVVTQTLQTQNALSQVQKTALGARVGLVLCWNLAPGGKYVQILHLQFSVCGGTVFLSQHVQEHSAQIIFKYVHCRVQVWTCTVAFLPVYPEQLEDGFAGARCAPSQI